MKTVRFSVLLASLLIMAACSTTTFVYNRLHTLILWVVDDYVDLSKPQSSALDAMLVEYFNRHRWEHLPRYVAILDQALVMLDSEVTAEKLTVLYRQTEAELAREQSQSLHWMLAVGESLTDAQIEDFIATLHDKQAEYEEEYLERDEEEFRRDTYKNLQETLADYLGRLSGDQVALLNTATGQFARWDYIWLEDRQQWVDTLAVHLQRQPGWQQQVRRLVENRYDMTSVQYKDIYSHNLGLTLEATAAIIASRTEKQDRHLRRKLRSLREDLCLLVSQGSEKKPENSIPQAGCPAVPGSGLSHSTVSQATVSLSHR